jgi:hypothetical protein
MYVLVNLLLGLMASAFGNSLAVVLIVADFCIESLYDFDLVGYYMILFIRNSVINPI